MTKSYRNRIMLIYDTCMRIGMSPWNPKSFSYFIVQKEIGDLQWAFHPFYQSTYFFIFDWIYRDFCCFFLSNATYQKSCLSTTVGHEVKWGRVWKAASFVSRVLKTCWQNNLRQTRMGWKKKPVYVKQSRRKGVVNPKNCNPPLDAVVTILLPCRSHKRKLSLPRILQTSFTIQSFVLSLLRPTYSNSYMRMHFS